MVTGVEIQGYEDGNAEFRKWKHRPMRMEMQAYEDVNEGLWALRNQ